MEGEQTLPFMFTKISEKVFVRFLLPAHAAARDDVTTATWQHSRRPLQPGFLWPREEWQHVLHLPPNQWARCCSFKKPKHLLSGATQMLPELLRMFCCCVCSDKVPAGTSPSPPRTSQLVWTEQIWTSSLFPLTEGWFPSPPSVLWFS